MEHLKRPCIQHQRRERQRRHFFWSKKQPLPDPEPVKMFIERAVVEVPKPANVILPLMNIFFPGVGSIVSSFYATASDQQYNARVAGFLQLLTTPIFIGRLWSIWHGWKMFRISQGMKTLQLEDKHKRRKRRH